MENKINRLRFFVLVVFLSTALPLHAEVSPEVCSARQESIRVKSSLRLDAIENHYRLMEWYYLKYWETVYHPLWKARQNQGEILSEKVRAEADVLFVRYQHSAESYQSIAREEWKGLLRELAKLRAAVDSIPGVCAAPAYPNCFEPRLHDLHELITSLKQWLAQNHDWNEDFSNRVRASLNEGPGDHDRFEFRFHDQLEDKRSKMGPLFLRHLRSIHEKLDFQWPGPECCQTCKPENLIGPADPVFQVVRMSYQGHHGVSGARMNGTDLVNAFDDFELEKKMKDEMREKD